MRGRDDNRRYLEVKNFGFSWNAAWTWVFTWSTTVLGNPHTCPMSGSYFISSLFSREKKFLSSDVRITHCYSKFLSEFSPTNVLAASSRTLSRQLASTASCSSVQLVIMDPRCQPTDVQGQLPPPPSVGHVSRWLEISYFLDLDFYKILNSNLYNWQ